MSQEVFIRGMFSGFMSLALAWNIFCRQDRTEPSLVDSHRQKYQPDIPGMVLPFFLLIFSIMFAGHLGLKEAARMLLSMCFSIFLQISLYYLVLLLILPELRKYISARSCAMLWILPNYLYLISQSYMKLPKPLWVITVPGRTAWILLTLWFLGFVTVFLWKIPAHLAFRRRVLKDAVSVEDPEILMVWNGIVEDSRVKKPRFKLVTSSYVSSPITIGLFRRTTRVVLPRRLYSQDSLKLILRHELIHICREDAWNKFFLVFCTAMCWFNPLMWIAMRKSAEDLELSCDETVLLDAEPSTREQYAHLLLNTAADERGFTICLSASASAMRYRLKRVVKPSARHSGAWIVGAVFFILCMTSGYVSLAYDADSGAHLIYQNTVPGESTIQKLTLQEYPHQESGEFSAFQNRKCQLLDEDALHDYLSGLTLYQLSGNYSFKNLGNRYSFTLQIPKGILYLDLYDQCIQIFSMIEENRGNHVYYIKDGLDWDYLNSIILPLPPVMLNTSKEGYLFSSEQQIYPGKLWRIENGLKTLLYQDDAPFQEFFYSGSYPDHATLLSPYVLESPSRVLVEHWNNIRSYTITQPDKNSAFTIKLAYYPAHYTLHSRFYDESGVLYEAQYEFGFSPHTDP